MNCQAIHDRIIERARARAKPDGYCERHHVVPRSLGGSDEPSNLVWLTGREHYIVHWLLYRIHGVREMALAWHRMTFGRKAVRRYTSHTFVYAKRARSKAMSELFRGKKLSAAHKEKLRAAKLGRTYTEMGRDPATSRKGQTLSPEQKARVGAAARGRKASEETRKKLSASKTGPLNPRFGKPAHNRKRKDLEKERELRD